MTFEIRRISPKILELRAGTQTSLCYSSHIDKPFHPIAVCDGDSVYFPDQEYTPAQTAIINAFYKDKPHVRINEQEFRWQFASSTIRGCRPMLYPPKQEDV